MRNVKIPMVDSHANVLMDTQVMDIHVISMMSMNVKIKLTTVILMLHVIILRDVFKKILTIIMIVIILDLRICVRSSVPLFF